MYFFLFENCHTTPIPVTHRYESVIQVYQTNLIYVLRLCMEILFSPFEVYKVFCSHVHRHLNTYYRNTHSISAYWTNSTHEQVIDVSHTPWYSFWLTSRWHFLNVLCIRKLFKSIIQFVQIRISTLEYHMLSRLLYIHVHCQVFNCILQNFISHEWWRVQYIYNQDTMYTDFKWFVTVLRCNRHVFTIHVPIYMCKGVTWHSQSPVCNMSSIDQLSNTLHIH